MTVAVAEDNKGALLRQVRLVEAQIASPLGRQLYLGALAELLLSPKPGLVDQIDAGSHADLNLFLMLKSVRLLGTYLGEIEASVRAGEPLAAQVAVGREAERRMFAQLGTNTHKGYIFIAGVAVIARLRHPHQPLRDGIRQVATELFPQEREQLSNGMLVRQAAPRVGIREEALRGFPAVFDHGLPLFRALAPKIGVGNALYALLGELMQRVEDSTTVSRAGMAGLARLKADGATLVRLCREHFDPRPFLQQCNTTYRQRRITMGGVADLLAFAQGCLLDEGMVTAEELLAAVRWEPVAPVQQASLPMTGTGGRRPLLRSLCRPGS